MGRAFTIPTLCYHRDLSPVGSCLLCLIKVNLRDSQVAACKLPALEGMVVRTEAPRLAASRLLQDTLPV